MFIENCPSDSELEEYAFRKESLPERKEEKIRLHLRNCPDCMDILSAYLSLENPRFVESSKNLFKKTHPPQEIPEGLGSKLQRGTVIKIESYRERGIPRYLDRFSLDADSLEHSDLQEMAADSGKPKEIEFPLEIESEDGSFGGTLDFDEIEDRLILNLQDQRLEGKGEGSELLVRIPEREIEKTIKLKDGKAQAIFELGDKPDTASSIEIFFIGDEVKEH